jgi:hypothetical protein
MQVNKSTLAAAVAVALGSSASMLPNVASAVGLADGFYNMTINNTPFSGGYQFGTDGAWNSSFTFGSLPGSGSNGLYDDTVASPVNGKYDGNPNDGVQGTVAIKVEGGVITGTGLFEFDMIPATAGGNFVEYGDSTNFTGSIDASGNISLSPTGILGAVGGFPSLVDERWNVDNFNGLTGTTPNPPSTNTAWDAFSTGSATNSGGTINGAAFDGTSAILVKGGTVGSDWGGFFGAQYFEVWNVGFTKTGDLPPPSAVPVPAAVWLFGSGLMGLVGVARRRKSKA